MCHFVKMTAVLQIRSFNNEKPIQNETLNQMWIPLFIYYSPVSCPAARLQTSRDVLGETLPVRELAFPRARPGELMHSTDMCGMSHIRSYWCE